MGIRWGVAEKMDKARTFELFFSHGRAVVKVEEGWVKGFGGRLILWVYALIGM